MMERRLLDRSAAPLGIICQYGDVSFRGNTKDISKKGLCLAVPSPRIKTCMFDLLHKNVTLEVDNETIDGNIRWYTLEGTTYYIGINVGKQHMTAWKRILHERERPHPVKPAAVIPL